MRKIPLISTALFVAILVFMQSCEKGNNDTRISQYGGHSHNSGRNCMGCHYSGGEGSGWFNIAGTVYDSAGINIYPNTTVYLSTGPNMRGTIVDTLYGNASGSFYTTLPVDLTVGLYANIVGTNGTVKSMSTTLTSGACNSCHGVSTNKLWTY